MFHWTTHLKGVPTCPCSRAVYVVVGPKVYSFGWSNADQTEVHVFNTVALCWRKLPWVIIERGEHPVKVPISQFGHTAVLVDVVYIWGGYPFCNLLYAYDVGNHRWSTPNVYGTIPEARYYHSACVLEKVMFIYGGCTEQGFIKDIYKLDTTTMVWALIYTTGSPPPFSTGHSATIIGTKMFISLVHTSYDTRYNNITVFDTKKNTWLSMPSGSLGPDVGLGHSAFANNGELYIFGGRKWSNNNYLYLSDLWKFSPETLSWKQVKTKGKGLGGVAWMGCCMVGERIFIFGGFPASDNVHVLNLNPSLKTFCKLAVIQHGLKQSALAHNIKWELAAIDYHRQQRKRKFHSERRLAHGGQVGHGLLVREQNERPKKKQNRQKTFRRS